MKNKSCILLGLLLLLSFFDVGAQFLKGRITDSLTGKPLEYVSIGVMDSRFGATTDEKGYYCFEIKKLDSASRVRISMIGYKAQVYSIEELKNTGGDIRMTVAPIELAEVVIKPFTSERKVGATGFNRMSGWSGWGGMYIRKGYEMGTRIELGNQPVRVKSLHVRLHRQAFDTSFCRLHIRAMEDTLITRELLTENIIVSMTEESGWALIDLDPYKLVLSGTVALTLEWLKVEGVNKDRAMKINGRMTEAYILFKNQKNVWGLYRWGTEAPWILNRKMSPSMYLSIQE